MKKVANILILLAIIQCFGFNAEAFDAFSLIKMAVSSEAPSEISETQSCGQGATFPVKTCDIGAGFLCVSTPPLSVVDEYVFVRGTVDRSGSQFSGISANIQNEYTRELNQIKPVSPNETKDCLTSSADYCLSEEGYFSLKVPLTKKLGPHTISIAASRSDGPSAESKVRVSRVVAPKISSDDVTLTPDPYQTAISGSTIQINIDPLHECQFCDFLGISTGGLNIIAMNTITASDGGVKQVKQTTNMAAAGSKFSLCMPVSNGINKIRIIECNAATEYDESKCPYVDIKEFNVSDSGSGVIWIKEPKKIYNTVESVSDLDLSFKLGGNKIEKCEESTTSFVLNRGQEETLCSDESGIYKIHLTPETGINVGVIKANGKEYPFTFGWGDVVSPFTGKGTESLQNAGGFIIRKDFLVTDVRDLINNYLKSGEIQKLVKKLPELLSKSSVSSSSESSDKELDAIKNEIPMCGSDGSDTKESTVSFTVSGTPTIGLIEIPKAEISQDKISIVLNVEKLKIIVKTFADADHDGKPDDEYVMPLKISFKKIFAPIEIGVQRSSKLPIFVIGGPYTDCEYKLNHDCKGRPAVLVPRIFVGDATPSGNFIACDINEGEMTENAKEACIGLNMLNGEMNGAVGQGILELVNKALYCDLSASLTHFMREAVKGVPLDISPFGSKLDKNWEIPLGLDLLTNQFNVSGDGISGIVPATIGSDQFYSKVDKAFANPNVGYIAKPYGSNSPAMTLADLKSSGDVGISISENLVNSLLFLLNMQDSSAKKKGPLDWDIDELLFKKFDFDFIKECDSFVPTSDIPTPSALCNLRPRVGEMMGSSLTTAGYFSQKQPVRLSIKGNRNLSPRISFFNKNGKQYVDLQFGDLDLAFYALKTDDSIPVDKYGNYAIKTDQNGDPVIHSMNPNDPDPLNGPIIKLKLTILLAVEVSNVMPDPDDPSRSIIKLRPDSELTRIIFTNVPGGNFTTIKDGSIFSAFKEKLKYAVNIYSSPEKALSVPLPKEFNVPRISDEFSILGLDKISFGKEGLGIYVDSSQDYLKLVTEIVFSQKNLN